MSKAKKVKWLIKGIALFLITLFVGYHMYCHYMVKKFFRYIDAGDWEAALVQVEKMPDVNMVDMCSPLYCLSDILLQGAASEGVPLERAIYKHAPVSIFEALLEKGADPNKKAPRGILTPFQYLCNHYETSEKDEKIELMVQHGADISSVILPIPGWFQKVSEQERESAFRYISFLWENGVTDRMHVGTKYECTVLHSAARMLDTEYLSRLYHDEKREMDYLLNEKDIYGETPLFFAVRGNEPDNCAFLINEGADMDIKNNEGKTAYDVAVELGDEACMALLGQGSATDYIFYLEDEGVRENPVFAAIMHEMWEELGEGREIRNVAYEEDVQKIPMADVVRANREQDKECAEAYFYLLEGEWVAAEYAGTIRDLHFEEAGEEAYQEELQEYTDEVIEKYLGSEYRVEMDNLLYFGPYTELSFILEDDDTLFNVTRFIAGEFITITPPYIGLSAHLADKEEWYRFIIDADGTILIEIEYRFFRLEKK